MSIISDFIGKELKIVIDRPIGSKHPDHGFVYPINYGYVPDTVGLDGEPIDAYILGITKPVNHFSGKCIAVIHRLDDNDDKLVITKDGNHYYDKQIKWMTNFQEKFFTSTILRG